jgi:hypothetical protein
MRPRRHAIAATVLVALAGLLPVRAAHAAELFVAPGATPKADCIAAADPCATIAAAIDQSRALAGPDTIHLAAGSYDETVALDDVNDAGLTLAGAGAQAGGSVIAPGAIAGGALVRVAPPASGVTLRDLRVVHLATAPSDKNLVSASAPGTLVQRVVADVQRPASVGFAYALNGGPVTLDHAESAGVPQWNGSAVNAGPGDYDVTIADSHLRAGANQPALQVSTGVRAIVARSVFERPTGDGVTVNAGGATLRMDSSLVLGGKTGVQIGSSAAAAPGAGTLRNVTVDAGATRGAADAGATAVRAGASNDGVATATVASSVTVEGQWAEDFQPTASASVACSDSDVPAQAQAKGGALGVIACDGSGSNASNAPAALFANAPAGDYRPPPGSPAVDAGSPVALAADESAADLDGNPRVLDGDLDCAARRDRGAYELTGRQGCLPAAKDTVRPVVSKLTLKRMRLRLRLSEPAKLRVAVERAALGRKVGKKCTSASRARRKRPRCTRWLRVTTLKRSSKAGAVKLSLPARRLAGRHRVVVVATDAAGNRSSPVVVSFTASG